jgi:hypothetical protein
VRCPLAQIGIAKSTFYTWLDRYAAGGLEAFQDRKARPERVWNRMPDRVREKVIALALEQPELSSLEVAIRGAPHHYPTRPDKYAKFRIFARRPG